MAFRIIVGGSPKSGTTLFHNLLKGQREVASAQIKQTNFFLSDEEVRELGATRLNSRTYSMLFPQESILTLDTSPDYLYSEYALRRIKEEFEESGGIFVVLCRNPVERFLSHFNHLKQQGIIDQEETIESHFYKCQEGLSPFDLKYRLLQLGKYQHYIQRAKLILGENAVVVISFSDLINNPVELACRFLKRIGIKHLELSKIEYDFSFENKTMKSRYSYVSKVYRYLRKFAIENLSNNHVYVLNKLFSKPYKFLNLKPLEKLNFEGSLLNDYYVEDTVYLDSIERI